MKRYGDYKPTQRLSRAVAVFYIFIGLVMSSLMVGSIVSAITTVTDASKIKIYGTKIGAINGSFEERVGMLRNGQMNPGNAAYTSVSQLKEALLSEKIQGVLVDAYTAGSKGSLFEHPLLRAVEVIHYPRAYGFVLSGDLANMADEARGYVFANQQLIMSLIEESTTKMEASEEEPIQSIFDADSKIYQITIVSLTVALVVFVMLGVIYQCWRRRRKRRISNIKSEKNRKIWHQQQEIRTEKLEELKLICEDFYQQFNQNVEMLLEKHALAVLKHLDKEGSFCKEESKAAKEPSERFSLKTLQRLRDLRRHLPLRKSTLTINEEIKIRSTSLINPVHNPDENVTSVASWSGEIYEGFYRTCDHSRTNLAALTLPDMTTTSISSSSTLNGLGWPQRFDP